MPKRKTKIKPKFYDRKKLWLETIPLLFLIIIFGMAIYIYPMLPDTVPVHWNASGEIDNYGAKFFAVFIIPIIYLLFVILSFILPVMDVFSENIKSFYNYYYAMKIIFGMFFLGLYITTLLPNFGYAINVATVVIVAIIVLFFAIGIIMRHLKRNFFIGIRTPWTLANDIVWEKTHKLGGMLFIILSLLLLIGLFIFEPVQLYLGFIIGIIILVLTLMFYSYMLYRKFGSNQL